MDSLLSYFPEIPFSRKALDEQTFPVAARKNSFAPSRNGSLYWMIRQLCILVMALQQPLQKKRNIIHLSLRKPKHGRKKRKHKRAIHRRGDEGFVPELCHERHHEPGASGCKGRTKAIAETHPCLAACPRTCPPLPIPPRPQSAPCRIRQLPSTR